MRTRPAGAVMLLVAVSVIGAPGRADAHICLPPSVIPVGQLSTLQVGVTVEKTPVPDVEVDVPSELRIDRVDPSPGWQIIRSGQTLRYRGPAIPPFTCKYFSIGVTALTRGKYGLSVVQRDAEGNVVARSDDSEPSASNPFSRQIVYAGVKPPSPPRAGPSAVTIAGAALVGLGVVLVGVLVFRSWRARRDEDREDEVQERLDEFKKQARDRSADSDP